MWAGVRGDAGGGLVPHLQCQEGGLLPKEGAPCNGRRSWHPTLQGRDVIYCFMNMKYDIGHGLPILGLNFSSLETFRPVLKMSWRPLSDHSLELESTTKSCWAASSFCLRQQTQHTDDRMRWSRCSYRWIVSAKVADELPLLAATCRDPSAQGYRHCQRAVFLALAPADMDRGPFHGLTRYVTTRISRPGKRRKIDMTRAVSSVISRSKVMNAQIEQAMAARQSSSFRVIDFFRLGGSMPEEERSKALLWGHFVCACLCVFSRWSKATARRC